MSAEPLITAPTRHAARPWAFWWRQVLAILRLELKKSFLGRRAIGIYILAAMPVTIFALRAMFNPTVGRSGDLSDATRTFATIYQIFILRLVIFFGCVAIFGNLIRREMLERTLHYYFLSPVRREVLATAKYLTGLLVSAVLFSGAAASSFFLAYLPFRGLDSFFLHGPGLGHLLAYVAVTCLACVGYGAVFFTFGFFFKSPAIPAIVVFGWEFINFLLPPFLKKISMIYYLTALCPVPISLGPFALTADAPTWWLAVPGIFVLVATLLVISGRKVRRMEISYEED